MYTPPSDIEEPQLGAALRRRWGFSATAIEYRAVGFGSYHWIATNAAGERRFVTVDEIPQDDDVERDATFVALERAFTAAAWLRDRAGLDFVVAPLASASGAVVHRLTGGYSIAIFPVVDGRSADFGEHGSSEERAAVLDLLCRLHAATPTVVDVARSEDFALPHRPALERALAELDQPWRGGPFSEPARHVLSTHVDSVLRRLERYDALRSGTAADRSRWVVTHGEPHAANVIWTASGPVLVDWDTLRIAPPERDLWMVLGSGGRESEAYESGTGTEVEHEVIELYWLWWDLTEIGTYLAELRAPHERDADTDVSWRSLQQYAAASSTFATTNPN